MRVLYESYLWAFDELGCEKFSLSMKHANILSALKDFNTEHGKAKGFLVLYLLGKNAEVRTRRKLGDLLEKYLYEIFNDTKHSLCSYK